MNKFEFIDKAIASRGDAFAVASDKIWEFAEISLEEKQSCELLSSFLKNEGFEVEVGVAGFDTAFIATFGSGSPKIGILGEYDALDGLSQKAGLAEHIADKSRTSGHGCGHNLLGVGSLAAAIAAKEYMQSENIEGTLIYYGCPGEEGCGSKAFMAFEGLYDDLDAALCWHPGDTNEVQSGSYQASIQVEYQFHGIASHAAGDPENGRSALDAVELMNLGVQFLREHIPHTDCLHYAITNAGGVSPNVVQAEASVLYMVRSDKVSKAKKLLERVDNIAKGAALMTDTTFTRKFIDGTSDTLSNSVLEKLLFDMMQCFGLPEYTNDEYVFAEKVVETYKNIKPELPGAFVNESAELKAAVAEMSNNGATSINNFIIPYYHSDKALPGSTDVGDTSYRTPTAQISAACWTSGSPGHSWQNVSVGATSIAHKGMLYAGKVLAAAAIELLQNAELRAAAMQEFKQATKNGIESPIEQSFKK